MNKQFTESASNSNFFPESVESMIYGVQIDGTTEYAYLKFYENLSLENGSKLSKYIQLKNSDYKKHF